MSELICDLEFAIYYIDDILYITRGTFYENLENLDDTATLIVTREGDQFKIGIQ